jgi:RNA polymerase sigma factor (sigma-70 family)
MTQIAFSNKLISLHAHLSCFAYSLTNNRENAKDLIQETYLKALANRDKFADNTNMKAWTFTIMKNIFINNYRRSVNTKTLMDNSEDLFLLNMGNKSEFVSAESHLSLQEIRKSILNLNTDQRKPFELQAEGYKYKEIAEKMNLTIGTVKSRIFFTRKKLMETLREFMC